MRTKLFIWGCLSLIVTGPLVAAPPSGEWMQRLGAAVEAAMNKNPVLAQTESAVTAARAHAAAVGVWPDPEIEVGLKDAPPRDLSLSRDDFTMEMVTASQKFPAAGKRPALAAAARASAEAARAERLLRQVRIAARVADSFFHLAELEQRTAIARKTRGALAQAVQVARERYRVGMGNQSDVLRADLEKTEMEERLLSLGAERREEAARWNALQGRAADADVAIIGPVEPVQMPVLPEKDLVRLALEKSPAVLSARAGIVEAQAQAIFARLESRPDWKVSAYYGRREKFEDLAGASVGVSLPFVHPRRIEALRAEKEADLEGARAALAAVRSSIHQEIESAEAHYQSDRDEVALYRDSLLPQGRIAVEGAREAYIAGKVDFLTYIHAVIGLDTIENKLAEKNAGIGRALASLQEASGLPLIPGTPGEGGGVNNVEK